MPSVAQHLAKQETAKLVDAVDKKCFVPLACTMWLLSLVIFSCETGILCQHWQSHEGAARSPSLTVNVVVEP